MAELRRKIVVAGGNGMLGRGVCPWLAGRGWEVVVLTRSAGPAGAGREDQRGVAEGSLGTARVRREYWDGRTVGTWARELEGARAVVNLAGRSVNCRYTQRNRREILESRVDSTRAIGEAVGRCARPPLVWINSSTATIYRHTFGEAWDERGEIEGTAEANDVFSVEVAKAWEQAFFGGPPEGGTPCAVRKVAIRTAIVLSRDRENMAAILRRLVKLGLGGKMGSGRQWVSWINEEDFCRAVEFLIEREDMRGVVNVAAPCPVTNSEMMRMFRETFGRRWGLPAAKWMLEVGAFCMGTETELVLKSRRVVPGRLLGAGFTFLWPELRGVLADFNK